MAGPLHLIPGAPAIGLTRNNKFASLHGDCPREASPSVFAPPRDSSSDEDSNGPQVLETGASDDSEFGGNETKRKSKINVTLSTSTDDNQKRELRVEPSNIRAGSFTSGAGARNGNGSQSSQKRKDANTDEDDVPFSFSQKKKPRQSYGSGSMNIHRGSVTKSANQTHRSPANSGKAGPALKVPPGTHAMLARLDRITAKQEESNKPRFREVPATQVSQRDQRASQRSAKSTQDSSQSSSKSFRQPPRPSPKKVPELRASPVLCKDPPRARGSSALVKTNPAPSRDNALKSSKFQNALNTAKDKLGIANGQTSLPPLATHDSSAPPMLLDAASTVSSPLSSLDGSTLISSQDGAPIITSADIPIYNTTAKPAVCPMCKQPVDRSYLEEFCKVDTRMSLRQQSQFCKAHKERSAKSEWEERGYPEIDWQQLDTRITKFHTFMDDVLLRRKSSFYRNAFEDTLKSGKNKTLQESLMGGDEIEGTCPGYYGGRGAKVMADNIMSRFASKLRRQAASDKLISSGGVSRYVQAVLVPELAILLIKDDMRVDDEKAREVLRDSVDIGNLLNEEEDEIIAEPAPTEGETVDTMSKWTD